MIDNKLEQLTKVAQESGKLEERLRIINLIRNTFNDPEFPEHGAYVWTEEIVQLIYKDLD